VHGSVTYPGTAYPVVQKGCIYFEAQVQLLFLFAVDLLNGPFLELVRGNRDRCIDGECWKEERESARWRSMVVRRCDVEVNPDKFQVRL
jgi:hypothetical protein